MTEVKLGKYKHFKGKIMQVLFIAKHSENLEEYIVYREMNDGSIWIRPKKMFLEEVEVNGKKVKRFEFLGN